MNEVLAEERSKRSMPAATCNGNTELMALPPPKEDREKELSSMIQDVETKHGKRR